LILTVLVISSSIGVFPVVATCYGVTRPRFLLDKALKLGLDLKGGVYLVVRVQTDEGLRIQTEAESERLREQLAKARVTFRNLTISSPIQIRIDRITPEQDGVFRQAATEAETTFERTAEPNGTYLFTLRPNVQAALREESVVQALQTIERRVNGLGVAEPSIARQGLDQIQVQLPGVTNITQAKQIIGSPGVLELKIVEGQPSGAKEALTTNRHLPDGKEIVPGAATSAHDTTIYYLVRKAAVVSGRDVRGARPSLDENGRPAVSFTLNAEGARKFSKATAENVGRQLAIVLDGRVQSAPVIEMRITTDGRIAGHFTQEEAQNLSLILRSGSLPAPLTYLQEQTIGPSLGADAIRSGFIASVVGLLLVIAFMLVYYRVSGVNAVVALLCNLVMLLGLMAYLGAVMTLPGIAGFLLTIGIGVDSNVLIFERIKEELERQRGVRASIDVGFSRVFLTLLDTHISALIAAAVLFQFGTGPIRGFAVTLSIGLISNLFTSTFVSKTLFELMLARRRSMNRLSI
jgi:preprotein translocase subunit SecD